MQRYDVFIENLLMYLHSVCIYSHLSDKFSSYILTIFQQSQLKFQKIFFILYFVLILYLFLRVYI